MTVICRGQRHGTAAIAFGLVGVALYLLMIAVTLARIETLSGLTPFDMRPLGYGPDDAKNLLSALGPEGRSFYLRRQLPLDAVYPAVLSLTLCFSLSWFGRHLRRRNIVGVGIAVSLGAGFFDYAENAGIAAMILNWPDVPDWLVYTTSSATVVKSAMTVFAIAITAVLGFAWLLQRSVKARSRR